MRKIAVFIILLLIFIPIASADPFTDWFRGLFGITGNVVTSQKCTATCTNGIGASGTQTWNGKTYGACSATTCASCKSGFKLAGGVCLASCTPNCKNKVCGASDGCSGLCDGSCKSPQTCIGKVCGCTDAAKKVAAAACVNCGASDGCGVTCVKGACKNSIYQTCGGGGIAGKCGCTANAKKTAAADCKSKNKDCSVSDGCENSCGINGVCSDKFETCGGGGNPNVCGCKETSYTPDPKTFCGTKNVVTNCKTTVSKAGTLACTSSQVCTNNACVQDKKAVSSAALAGGRAGFGDVLGALVPNAEWKYSSNPRDWIFYNIGYPSFSWPALFGGPAPVEPYTPASVIDPSNPSSMGVESNRDPCQETCGRGPKGKVPGVYDAQKCKDCDDRFRRVGY